MKLWWKRKARTSSICGCQAGVSLIWDWKMETAWLAWYFCNFNTLCSAAFFTLICVSHWWWWENQWREDSRISACVKPRMGRSMALSFSETTEMVDVFCSETNLLELQHQLHSHTSMDWWTGLVTNKWAKITLLLQNMLLLRDTTLQVTTSFFSKYFTNWLLFYSFSAVTLLICQQELHLQQSQTMLIWGPDLTWSNSIRKIQQLKRNRSRNTFNRNESRSTWMFLLVLIMILRYCFTTVCIVATFGSLWHLHSWKILWLRVTDTVLFKPNTTLRVTSGRGQDDGPWFTVSAVYIRCFAKCTSILYRRTQVGLSMTWIWISYGVVVSLIKLLLVVLRTSFGIHLSGSSENAGPDINGPRKFMGLTLQDLTVMDQKWPWHSRTWNCWTLWVNTYTCVKC